MAELLVLEPGVQTTVQDLGRPGFGDLGVTASGAFDRGAHERGARLLGNPDDSASLEILVGGLVATATTAVRAVLTGGLAPATVRGRPSSTANRSFCFEETGCGSGFAHADCGST